ncbi:hypothetical protein LTR37_009547 [Vermiconidia calcicola]|uniref:Uncharacterized protein n=1 Tax=Vermiconidia calcicola TaxID=1690605 RepID=A0ACC3N918_9PEZI|nr:hypothetical protein LTR37_009547 [Vermiconidia calcicola]
MPGILVAAELPTKGGEVREKVLNHLSGISKYARENEPGVTKYMICVPSDPTDTKTVWAFEAYADQAILDAHMAAPLVKDLVEYMTTQAPLEAAPTIRTLSWIDGMTFTKPEANEQNDRHIVFTSIEFIPGERDEALKYWKVIVDSSKDESGTFSCGLLTEEGKSDSLFSLEVYESERFLQDVHASAAAVQEMNAKTRHLRKEMKLAHVKLHAGYVYKKP